MVSPSLALAVFLVAGCATNPFQPNENPQVSMEKNIMVTCNGISSGLITLAGFKNQLDANSQQVIQQVITVAKPICTAKNPPADEAQALQTLNASLLRLQAVQAQYGVKK